uniref:U1-type domain-containing protein n=2 Tax=Aegilops tauschii subsp. strangulata TaxID=200361 RepID=A0A453ELM8_AEGTS
LRNCQKTLAKFLTANAPEARRCGRRRREEQGGGRTEEMPLGKYYCDYCDKEFQDTAAARRRHLQGAQHHRARALWYDSVRRQGYVPPVPLPPPGL